MAERPRTSTLAFFLTTLGFTWILQLPAVLAMRGTIAGPIERFVPLAALGGFGPLVAAVLVARLDGSGVRALFRPLGQWRVPAIWWFVSLGLPGALLFVGMALYRLSGGHLEGPWAYPPKEPGRVVAMLLVPFVEEIGWRGLALPRLLRRWAPLPASVILGLVWAAWHVLMFELQHVPRTLLPVNVLLLISGSVVFTWIYLRTGRSLLMMVLAHVGVHLNNSHLALPGNAKPLVIQTIAWSIAACAVVIADRRAFRRAPSLEDGPSPAAGSASPACATRARTDGGLG